ncbi:group 1 glycosyl transferase [Flavobacterium magnum]|uniref:Group 1 glycosyl transferase n=2 Tax=Flavobacterium magnum TaxID=2162713 RepID=A0A2S0RDT5_9FLAO|nr:group 1 glycosyl transferase [Flavobacterium magnum]
MDHFFWEFDRICRDHAIEIDWFFPNTAAHGTYTSLHIIPFGNVSVEAFFLQHLIGADTGYAYIITHFVELCTPFFSKLRKLTDATVITVDHNPRPLHGYPVRKRIEKRIKGILFSRYIDKFIGVSQYTENQILKDFGRSLKRKTAVIYNGVIIDDIDIRQTQHIVPKFMTASHLRFSKGIQDLIEAVAGLPATARDLVKVDVYGDGPYKETLLENIRNRGVENQFVFMGSRADLNKVFCNYDFMIQPTHMECFSLAILESLAANVPVITTNVGGNEEVIVDGVNGFIFPAADVGRLRTLLAQILKGQRPQNQEMRHDIELSFSIRQMVENHFQLIKPKP